MLGAGGFGIVYLAFDHVLLREVAIKEYMPTALAVRRGAATVAVRSPQAAETFAIGLDSFINEARLLASFDHPSLVKVHRFWKANGTAYMVTPYYRGHTLKQARLKMTAAPDATWLCRFVYPLLGALEVLHREGVYHRDISPDNVLLLPDGQPVLLDFGSARRVIGDRTQALTALLKPNFAPVEQYADDAGMRQGPWTDIYALGATVYFMLTAQPPVPAVMRVVRDTLPLLSAPGRAGFRSVPREFLATIDWTLAVAPSDRPQSVAAVRRAFAGEISPPVPAPRGVQVARRAGPEAAGPGETATASPRPRLGLRYGVLASCLLVCIGLLGWFAWVLSSSLPASSRPVNEGAAASAPRPAPPAAFRASATGPAAEAGPEKVLQASSRALPPRAVPDVIAADSSAVVDAPKPQSRLPKIGQVSQVTQLRKDASAAIPKVTEPSPRELCGGLTFLSRAICMNRQCQLPDWRGLPECVEARRPEVERQRRMEQQ